MDKDLDVAQFLGVGLLFQPGVVVGLHHDPVGGREAEGSCQAQPCGWRDATPAVKDLSDVGLRQASRLGKPVGADPERLQKVFSKNFAGMDRCVELLSQVLLLALLSVVVDDLDVRWGRRKHTADPE
ncbi:hypothetical protein GCM10027059_22460 [Myceligenerans halotolerans]